MSIKTAYNFYVRYQVDPEFYQQARHSSVKSRYSVNGIWKVS